MKIEIAESLAQSWLKHVRGCQVVQLNWKAQSGDGLHQVERAQRILRDATTTQGDRTALFELGKKDEDGNKVISLNQFLQQAEVDAFGVRLDAPPTTAAPLAKLYAVDIAFHAGGLGYKNNPKVVAKKMVRSALTLLTNFNASTGVIVFATPVINKKELAKVTDAFTQVEALFEKHKLNYEFEFIANERFQEELLVKTMKSSRHSSDMGELFLRSLKLLQGFNMLSDELAATLPPPVIKKQKRSNPSGIELPVGFQALSLADLWDCVVEEPGQDQNLLKIGAGLQLIFQRLDQDDDAFIRVKRVLEAGTKLGLGKKLTTLLPYTETDNLRELRKDSLGRNRYYADPLPLHRQLLNSQWTYKQHAEWKRIFQEAGVI